MDIEEFEFIIRSLNTWFEHRVVLTDPPSLCARTLRRVGFIPIAPDLIMESGGDISAVENGLEVAKRFSPERDLAGLALFEREGRIHIGQYTYRNTFLVDVRTRRGHPIRRVTLQSIRPARLIPFRIISALEAMISGESLNELEIQNFLLLHPEILQTLGYSNVRPHICLYTEDKEKLIPDFLLEIPGGGGFDILDLKLPSTRIVVRKPYLRMSNQLVKAVAQLRKYSKFFDSAAHRKQFIRRYGLEPFKPELIVVIGRNDQFTRKNERVEIQGQMGSVRLLTYDDLIAYGRSRSIILPESYDTV